MKKTLLTLIVFVASLPIMRAQSTIFISCHNPIQFWHYSGQHTAYFTLVDDLYSTGYEFMYLPDCNASYDVGLYQPIGQIYLDSNRKYRIEWNNISPWFFINVYYYGNNTPTHVRFYFRNDVIQERVEFCTMTFDTTSYTTYYTLSYPYNSGYSNWFDASNLNGFIQDYNIEMAIE